MISEEIPDALAGERIDRVVAMLTGCTRAEASAAIEADTVTIDDGVVAKPSVRVRAGQRVSVSVSPVQPEALPQPDPTVEIRVVYEDDDVIVIDKPTGLIVHPGAGHRGSTLVNGLLVRFPELADVGEAHRPGIVHRLDKGTSGLMVVARNVHAYEDLVEQLSTHTVSRRYLALVWGHFTTLHGTIDAPVGRSRRDPLKMTISADGREARTHYEVLSRFEEPKPTSLVACQLETGRTHQIRVHLRSIGHSVVGDDLYNGQKPSIPMDHPFLHATQLSFDHPGTGELVTFDSPLPEELQHILDRLS